ncbi:AAA-like domain-containing protein [Roseofilum capinflatum]|uniref:AAA-like domain-containing protein n=1 Tax=Roseofilum capinflatum BLCC-M114 TaxID=3022440 RepID=A0ABT7B201_9CYAN|nr:AAA-like domain-containing protein [Roseofilum capinflatum]MDJ1173193.1 AAA-like domain-containing protein [Roseofilum capinflatum BLCC-M114]
MPTPLDNLSPEERKDWRELEQRLQQAGGTLTEVSQRELAEEFHVSPATLKRRLEKFKDEGLIDVEVEGKGRYSKTTITLSGYQPPYQALNERPMSPLVGVLPLNSLFRLEREADRACQQAFQIPRTSRIFLRLKGIRHSGKSTSLAGLREWLEREQGHCVGYVNLSSSAFSPNAFEDLSKLLYEFTNVITTTFRPYLRNRELPDLKTLWRDDIASGLNCETYLADHVFSQLPTPATLLIDGLDKVIGHPSTQNDFCNILRTWNEEKMKNVGQGPIIWPNIVVAYSTEPYPTHGIVGSVFYNVGLEINLSELTESEVTELAGHYQLPDWNSSKTQELMKWVGGHPALIQEALFYLSGSKTLTIADLGGPRLGSDFFRNHLFEKMQLLQPEKPSPLLTCFQTILKGEDCRDEYAKFQLEQAGLIQFEAGKTEVIELYRQYFGKVLSPQIPR